MGNVTTSGPTHGLVSLALGLVCWVALVICANKWLSAAVVGAIIATAWTVSVALAGSEQIAYLQIWGWLRLAPLVVCTFLFVRLTRKNAADSDSSCHQVQLLFACFLAFIPLIQIPFPHGIYILYFAPLAIAGWMIVHAAGPQGSTLIGGLSLIGLLLSSLIWLQREDLRFLGSLHQAEQMVWSDVDHATIKTTPRMHATYAELTGLLKQLSAASKIVYAGPDAPEIPFLAQTAYWHPALYDLFEPLYFQGIEIFEQELDRQLIAAKVDIVVFNMNPSFSRRLSEGFLSKIATRYGNAKMINNQFLVIWSDAD